MDNVRIGFVGVGGMGQMAHLRNYAFLPDCEVVAIAEPKAEQAKAVAARYGIARNQKLGHGLGYGDIDGDGKPELVTGKRYRAHCGKDPGEYDPYGISYFKWNGQSFTKMPIIFGPVRQTKGCGIHFQVVDLDGDSRLDIVAPGKDGLWWFRNLGFAENMGD